MNILIHDSHDDIAESLKSFLELNGYTVQTTDNFVSAISLCELSDIQLLISDYDHRNPNFLKLFKLITKKQLQTKIMVLTCDTLSLSESQKLLGDMVDCIFVEPIDPQIILDTIQYFEKTSDLSVKA